MHLALSFRIIALGFLIAAAAGCSREANGQEHQQPHHGAEHQQGHQPAAKHQGHDHSAHGTPAPQQNVSDPVLVSYLHIQKALASDSINGVAAAASSLSKAAAAHQGHGGSHGEVATGLIQAASGFQGADLASSRVAFKTLSQQMIRYREIMPGILSGTYVIHCSMANASWVQTTELVANPYHGSSMLRCGEVTKARGIR